jgi:hypothetical protein
MKAKTKRRIKHVLTKKKLVKKKTSRHVMRSFIIVLATVCTGSLAYAIATTRPVITVGVHSGSPDGRTLTAPATPTPVPTAPGQGAPDQAGRASWYALGLPAPDSLTCASRTYPRGSFLYVKNTRNGRTVTCRVNDYGPAIWTNRVIDLSRGSFREIDSLGSGTTSVQIWRLSGAPTGFNIPITKEIGQIIGYNFCQQAHTAQYCEEHRQD